jgi:hypothetical protein
LLRIAICDNDEDARIESGHDEVRDFITPGLDPGAFFAGKKEDARIESGHDELL